MNDINVTFELPSLTEAPPPEAKKRDLLTPLADNDYLMVVDNTAMEKFTTCPVSAYNYLVLGRESNARSAGIAFGGAIHEGLEGVLKGEDDTKVHAAVSNYLRKNPLPPADYRTESAALEILRHYRERAKFPDYEWTLLERDGEPIIEKPFELPLGVVGVNTEIKLPQWEEPRYVRDIHVAWSGRIDALAYCNNRNRVVDHKTTSIAGDQFIQDFQLSNQTQGYVWAAQQLYPEENVTGFCLNAIHFKRPTPGVGLLDKGPRGGAPALAFFRAFFEYSPERLAQWETNAITLCSDFIHCLVRKYFPAHTKWCFGKYGACPYHMACTIDDPAVREKMLLSDAYKAVTWDPTNAR